MARASFVGNLESLRGLAAVSVCLFHAGGIRFHGASAGDSPIAFLLDGFGAVVLFFVLSGYVLRLSLQRHAETAWARLVAGFLIARAFRLYPTVIASVLLLTGAAAILHDRFYSPIELIKNAALIDTTINGVFWTLQVEVVGSVLVVVAFLIERRFGLKPLIVLALCVTPLAFVGTSAKLAGAIPSGLLQGFLFGYLAAALPPPRLASSFSAPTLLAAGVIAFYLANAIGNPLVQWPHLLTEAGATAMVLALAAERLESALMWPPLRWLGALSYSFYAVHPLGLDAAGAFAKSLEGVEIPAWIGVGLVLIVSVAATIPVAAAMRYLVERPGIALGRRLLVVPPRREVQPA